MPAESNSVVASAPRRILQRYAAELRESYALEATSLYDVNGNRVGAVTVVEQGQRRQPGRGRE